MTLRGLYAITTESLCRNPAQMSRAVSAALAGGAVLVQYRDKWNAPGTKLEIARQLVALCGEHGARLIVNDDPQLAAESGAHGVHLGSGDSGLAGARRLLGGDSLIGVTCGNRPERAEEAQAQGAGYVSFGRFFASRTKPEAPPAASDLLRQLAGRIQVPVCVIGGLTPDNAAPLVADGANLVAAAGGLFDAPDVTAQARRYAALFTRGQDPAATIPR